MANCPQNCENKTSLTFVAHDIEGSVIKQALVIASQEEKYSRVLEDTHLLVCGRLLSTIWLLTV